MRNSSRIINSEQRSTQAGGKVITRVVFGTPAQLLETAAVKWFPIAAVSVH